MYIWGLLLGKRKQRERLVRTCLWMLVDVLGSIKEEEQACVIYSYVSSCGLCVRDVYNYQMFCGCSKEMKISRKVYLVNIAVH